MQMKLSMKQKEEQSKKDLGKAFKEFLIHCRIKNLSDKTISYYEECYSSFIKFYPETNLIREITGVVVENYIFWLRNTTGFNDISLNTRLRGIRTIMYYFMKLNYMEQFKIGLMRADKKIYQTYSEQELKILLKKPNIKTCSFTDFRDWSVCNTFIGTGIRVGTLIELKISDIDFDNDLINLRKMKGRKQQIIPMSSTLHRVLIEYIQFRNGDNQDYLFCSQYGGKLTVNAIEHSMRKYNRKRGVINTGLHRYRHTYAKMFLENGGNVFKLQKLLSHSSLDIVKEYVDIFTDDLQKDYDSFNPLECLDITKKKIKMKR